MCRCLINIRFSLSLYSDKIKKSREKTIVFSRFFACVNYKISESGSYITYYNLIKLIFCNLTVEINSISVYNIEDKNIIGGSVFDAGKQN